MLSDLEKSLYNQDYLAICGFDEVGIGPLAGPVVAACCIVPPKTHLKDIDDSKKLTSQQREQFFQKLQNNPNIAFGIGIIEPEMIDEINIHRAALLAMQHALEDMPLKPDYALIDGKFAPRLEIPHQVIIKGDGLITCIKAASIIAKVTRDAILKEYHKLYPQYSFNNHKGYGTKKHLLALQKHGPCPIHRRSYLPVKETHNLTALLSNI
ncbi:MAG: Ribonuclease HII [Chlamydiae bacterium]|nr:Ribonuclease HII [Chlamydiota bacterium]